MKEQGNNNGFVLRENMLIALFLGLAMSTVTTLVRVYCLIPTTSREYADWALKSFVLTFMSVLLLLEMCKLTDTVIRNIKNWWRRLR